MWLKAVSSPIYSRGSEAVVRTLLGTGADLNAQYGHLICPMIKEKPVCDGSLGRGRCRNVDIVRLLIDAGTDVNARGVGGGSALVATGNRVY